MIRRKLKPTTLTVLLSGLFSLALLLNACGNQPQPSPSPTSAPPTEPPQVIATEPPATTAAEATLPPSPTPLPTPTASPTPEPPTATPQEATVEPAAVPTETLPESCQPTPPDAQGPFYVPGAPERSSVGQGHLLDGVARSSADCLPIAGAQIEFWLAGPDGQYTDEYRATLFADEAGRYRFESNFPPPYSGRPPHIHLRVTAAGYQPLVSQYYPEPGQSEGQVDLVLIPDPEAQTGPEPALPAEGSALPRSSLFEGAWTDRSPFGPGLIEAERGVLDALPGASVYHLDVRLAEDLLSLTGREEILYTNQEDEPLNELYFRLFPNLARGSTTIHAVKINEQAVESGFELRNSAMRVPLSPALRPGQQVVIQLDFTVTVPAGEGGNYGTFAYAQDVLSLAHFYPLVAVYDDEGWNIEIAPAIGDVVYADTSFYLVRVTAPANQTLVASGLEIAREQASNQQVVTFAAGPVRDFYLAASDQYIAVSRTVGQTTINSYALAGLNQGAEAVLDVAAASLQSFEQHFGPYPFTEFDLVSTTTSALGIEYPGIVAILVDLYRQEGSEAPPAGLMEGVVAHEAAHQWFYSQVGNDQVDEPWLDEALAQFATLLYFSDVHGPDGATGFRRSLERRWARVNEAAIPIGRPVQDYSAQEYGAIVYGRGPLFIEALSEALGPETFAGFLRDYYQMFKWGIVTGEEFKQLAERHCGCDLGPLFEEWVFDGASSGG